MRKVIGKRLVNKLKVVSRNRFIGHRFSKSMFNKCVPGLSCAKNVLFSKQLLATFKFLKFCRMFCVHPCVFLQKTFVQYTSNLNYLYVKLDGAVQLHLNLVYTHNCGIRNWKSPQTERLMYQKFWEFRKFRSSLARLYPNFVIWHL